MVCSITRGPAKPISAFGSAMFRSPSMAYDAVRSEEHTSELQSPCNLVCRLLLEKKKKSDRQHHTAAQLPLQRVLLQTTPYFDDNPFLILTLSLNGPWTHDVEHDTLACLSTDGRA